MGTDEEKTPNEEGANKGGTLLVSTGGGDRAEGRQYFTQVGHERSAGTVKTMKWAFATMDGSIRAPGGGRGYTTLG